MKSSSLLIVGCGDLGTRVGLSMVQHGWRVIGARRSVDSLPAKFDRRPIDYTKKDGLASLKDLTPDYIVFTPLPANRSAEGYQQGFADAVAALASVGLFDSCIGSVMVSSTRVFAEQDGGWVDEDSALTQTDPSAAAIIEAERRFIGACSGATVLRASGIYGAPSGMLVRRVNQGEASPDPDRISNRIHRDDLARAIVFCLQKSALKTQLPSVLVASDNQPAPIGEVEDYLAARAGVELNRSGPQAQLPSGRGNRRCNNARLRSLGFEFLYPSFREGYADAG